jgi:hypothetical protein
LFSQGGKQEASAVRDWLSRIDKDDREKRDKRIFEMWLACYTGVEIAETVDCDEKTVTNVVSRISADLQDFQKTCAEHLADFDPPIYNIWKQQNKSDGVRHFGDSEARWVDNPVLFPEILKKPKGCDAYAHPLPRNRLLKTQANATQRNAMQREGTDSCR